jgi:hypothetical protein
VILRAKMVSKGNLDYREAVQSAVKSSDPRMRQIYLHVGGNEFSARSQITIHTTHQISRLLYDSQSVSQPVSQYVFVSSSLVGLATRYYFLSECCCPKFAVLFLCGALSDERTGLQFSV